MSQTETLQGAQLFMGQTEALPGLPAGISFTPWLLLRNTTDRPLPVKITVRYSRRANAGMASRAKVPPFTLEPQEVRRINLRASLESVVEIPERIHAAGLEIEHDGAPGELVAQLTSVDASGDHVFDMPMVDPVDLASNVFNYPFRLDGGNRTIVVLKNARREESRYWMRLIYEGGVYELGERELAPGQTVTIDLQELKERLMEDINGQVLPQWVERGQVEWGGEGGLGRVVGRAIVYHSGEGVSSSYSCGAEPEATSCIGFVSGDVCDPWPKPSLVGVVGETRQVTVYEKRMSCCTGEFLRDRDITTSSGVYY